MFTRAVACFAIAIGMVTSAYAQTPSIEVKEDGLKNETELSLSDTRGNAVTSSFGAKQQTGYKWDGHVVKGQARYFNASNAGAETARNWDLALRYERELTGVWSVYAGQGVESDAFAGIDRRYNTDIGGRYTLNKTPVIGWYAEAGYRYTAQQNTNDTRLDSSFGRLYTEFTYTMSETANAKLWLEYLPNFSHKEAYLSNAEASISSALSSFLSLKVGYLLKYNNQPPPPATQYLDRFLTTSLIAKF